MQNDNISITTLINLVDAYNDNKVVNITNVINLSGELNKKESFLKSVLVSGDKESAFYQYALSSMLCKAGKGKGKLIILNPVNGEEFLEECAPDVLICSPEDCLKELENIDKYGNEFIIVMVINCIDILFYAPDRFVNAILRLQPMKNVVLWVATGNELGLLFPDNIIHTFETRILFKTESQEFSKKMINTSEGLYLDDGSFIMYCRNSDTRQYVHPELGDE